MPDILYLAKVMNRQIAVLENNNGQVASFSEQGTVKIYIKQNEKWNVKDEVNFSIYKITDINLIRERIKKMVEFLDGCKIFVAEKIAGVTYSILEKSGINSWEISGRPDEFLDYVIEKEEEEEKKLLKYYLQYKKDYVYEPVETEKGYYFLDIIEVQQCTPGITTKQMLIPFFKKGDFLELVINCSHVPRWFGKELPKLNLKADIKAGEKGEVKVIIKNNRSKNDMN